MCVGHYSASDSVKFVLWVLILFTVMSLCVLGLRSEGGVRHGCMGWEDVRGADVQGHDFKKFKITSGLTVLKGGGADVRGMS